MEEEKRNTGREQKRKEKKYPPQKQQQLTTQTQGSPFVSVSNIVSFDCSFSIVRGSPWILICYPSPAIPAGLCESGSAVSAG